MPRLAELLLAFVMAFCLSSVVGPCIINSSNDVSHASGLIMPPTSKKLGGHIASGLFVRPSVRPSVHHAF